MRAAKIAAALVVAVVLITAWHYGVFEQFAEPAQIRDELIRLGPWGYLAFIVAYALLQPFGLPGMGFVIAASLIWPWPIAFALSMVGSCASTSFGFVFARFIAREWVIARLPARFHKYDAGLAARAFSTIFILRIMFLMQPMLHAFFGISKVRFSTHLFASAAAYAGPVLFISYFGQRAVDYAREAPIWQKVVVALIVLKIGVVSFLALRAWRKRQDQKLAAATVVTE